MNWVRIAAAYYWAWFRWTIFAPLGIIGAIVTAVGVVSKLVTRFWPRSGSVTALKSPGIPESVVTGVIIAGILLIVLRILFFPLKNHLVNLEELNRCRALSTGLAQRPKLCIAVIEHFKSQLEHTFTLYPSLGKSSIAQYGLMKAETTLELFWESYPRLKAPMERWNQLVVQKKALPNEVLKRSYQQAISSGLASSETEEPIYPGRAIPAMSGASRALRFIASLQMEDHPYIPTWKQDEIFLRYMDFPIVNVTGMDDAATHAVKRRLDDEIRTIPQWSEVREYRALRKQLETLAKELEQQFMRIEVLLDG